MRRLTTNEFDDEYPGWSPDGSRMIFQSHRNGKYGIWTMNTDGTDQVKLTTGNDNEMYPNWAIGVEKGRGICSRP
jgi:TolB protein